MLEIRWKIRTKLVASEESSTSYHLVQGKESLATLNFEFTMCSYLIW